MTMAIQDDSLALDGGVGPCPTTDQRGVARPQNGACDSGAYESEGPFPPADTVAPDTQYLTGPSQDTENTSAFTFTGTDDVTPADLLLFECRLIETEVGEPPEPPDPTEPPDPALAWLGCQNPWQVPVIEDGLFTFEVRAIDRAGNVDPTPAVHTFGGTVDVTPPQTFFLETPPNPSFSNSATFTFGATDDQTPPQFMEVECRIDSNDPEAWLECTNPTVFTNLTVGTHRVQARAADGADNVDPTPATYTWTVAPPVDCDLANITLAPSADVFVDQESPSENFVVTPQLVVRSGALATNARTLIRFPVSDDAPGCTLQSATLRLYAESGEPGRTLQAIPLAGAWGENTVTWNNQPTSTGPPATTTSGDGYREWNVTAQVAAMLAGDLANNGWLIRDAVEDDLEGAEQGFLSRETAQDPPAVTLPQLVLRFDASGTPPPPAPTPGAPATLACGDVVTESIVLQNDLLNCLGEGLVIGAPNIEVDLDGHTISGGALVEPGEEDGLLAGIRNGGHANVVIKDGTVRNFGYGVRLLAGARFNVVEGMTLIGNVNAGVELLDADDGRNGNTVRNNTFSLNGDGVALFSGTEGALIAGNTFNGNLGRAVYLFDSSTNRIEANTASGLTNDPLLDSDGGVFLEGSPDNVVIGNTISDAGDAGIQVSDGSHRNRIEGNTVFRTSDSSISVADSDGTEIVDNDVYVAGGAAIKLSNASGGTITGNDARFNPGGIELGGSNDNVIEGNDVVGQPVRRHRRRGWPRQRDPRQHPPTTPRQPASPSRVRRSTRSATRSPATSSTATPPTTTWATASPSPPAATRSPGTPRSTTPPLASRPASSSWTVAATRPAATASPSSASASCARRAPARLHPPPTSHFRRPRSSPLQRTARARSTRRRSRSRAATTRHPRTRCASSAASTPRPIRPPSHRNHRNPASHRNRPNRPTPRPGSTAAARSSTTCFPPASTPSRCAPPTRSTTSISHRRRTRGRSSPRRPARTRPRRARPSRRRRATRARTLSPTFRFRGTDNATPGPSLTYECSLDGASFTVCTSPVTYPGAALGGHTFAVRAVDLQGNTDLTPATHAWTIVAPDPDVTPPQTTIDSGPDLTTVSTDATFTFSTNEDGATFQCSLDGAAFTSCTSPVEHDDLDVDDHSFRVRAVDGSGNPDPTPATYDWTVAPPPVDAAVSCGQTLTQSTRITNDLLNCAGDGLVIGAHGITIDLDGHTIDGTSLGFGILNNGFDSVTITNGLVQEFDAGVQLGNGTALGIVAGVTMQLNELAGVQLANADDGTNGNIVRDNTVAGNGGGIVLLSGTQHASVVGNTVAGSAGESVRIQSSSGNRVEGNEISGSSDMSIVLEGASDNTVIGNEIVGSADASVVVHLGSNGNRIEANHLTEGEAGIIVETSTGNELIDNVAHDMGDSGIVLEAASDTLVRGNDVRFNSGGIEMSASTGNRIEGNDASETDGVGIEIGDMSTGNVVVQNLANGNQAGGISVEVFASPGSGNLLDRNTTNDNTGDGIYVGDVGHMIAGNTANNNEKWGINAADPIVAGVNIDGGGNRAIGNTGGNVDPITLSPLQCRNVVCDGGPPLMTDQVAPTTAISSAPVSPTLLTSATFRFTGSDNASPVDVPVPARQHRRR